MNVKSNSWVIVKKDTLEAIMETWNESILKQLRPKYEAIPIHEYLFKINREIREANEQSY